MTLRLALTGNSILERRLNSRTDPELLPLFDLIRGADIAFTNLEVLPNDFRGHPAQESGGSHFGAPAWVIDELRDAGFDLFATATNHCARLRHLRPAHRIGELDGARRCLRRDRPQPRGRAAAQPSPTRPAPSPCSPAARPSPRARRPARSGPTCPAAPASARCASRPCTRSRRRNSPRSARSPTSSAWRQQRQQRIQLGFAFPPDDPAVVPLGDMLFRAAAKPAIRTKAKPADLDAIARWVREARRGADLVLVSLHAHEQGERRTCPPSSSSPSRTG